MNADVRDAAKSVLGDLFGLNYLVDRSVQGTISVQTNQPLSRKDVLPAFQIALRVNGLTLARRASSPWRMRWGLPASLRVSSILLRPSCSVRWGATSARVGIFGTPVAADLVVSSIDRVLLRAPC